MSQTGEPFDPYNMLQMQQEIHETAHEKGWWEDERTFGDVIALCHSELSESLEEYRNNVAINMAYYKADNPTKPEGPLVEMADCIIRILDFATHVGVDMAQVIRMKMEYNKTRPHRHGGKAL